MTPSLDSHWANAGGNARPYHFLLCFPFSHTAEVSLGGDYMKLPKLVTLFVFLLTLLCASAVGQFCAYCNCNNGICICPVCVNHFPGQCAISGCVAGANCCQIADCGFCTCLHCSTDKCTGFGPGCNSQGCPLDKGVIENVEANNHLQPWMVDETLPAQLATYSESWSVIIARLQHDFSDTTEALSSRRLMLLPNITHLELGFPEYKESVIIETKYSAQKGGWVFRLIKGLKEDQSKGDILVFMPHSWSLHREEPQGHLGNYILAVP